MPRGEGKEWYKRAFIPEIPIWRSQTREDTDEKGPSRGAWIGEISGLAVRTRRPLTGAHRSRRSHTSARVLRPTLADPWRWLRKGLHPAEPWRTQPPINQHPAHRRTETTSQYRGLLVRQKEGRAPNSSVRWMKKRNKLIHLLYNKSEPMCQFCSVSRPIWSWSCSLGSFPNWTKTKTHKPCMHHGSLHRSGRSRCWDSYCKYHYLQPDTWLSTEYFRKIQNTKFSKIWLNFSLEIAVILRNSPLW